MVTKNSINSNIPIEISKGGTNSTSFADANGSVYFDSSKLVTISPGTSGQVLSSNGIAAAADYKTVSGSFFLVSSQDATGSPASIDFTGLTTYGNLLLQLSNVVLSDDSTDLLLNVSDDNGATWSGADYLSGINFAAFDTGAPATMVNENSTTSFLLGHSLDETFPYSGTINLFELNSATRFSAVGRASYTDTSIAKFVNAFLGGSGIANVDAIQIIPASGTITSGTFSLYGYGV